MKRVMLLVVALLAVTAACGIPSDHVPRQIADDKVPFGLLGPTNAAQANTVPGGPSVRLFFLDGTHVHEVFRGVPNLEPQTVLTELVKGLADTDPAGITTAIPRDTQVIKVVEEGQTLVVTLNNAILNIAGAEQKNAFGQLVYTATDLAFDNVRFQIPDANGVEQPVPTPTDSGAKTDPVDRADFLSLQG